MSETHDQSTTAQESNRFRRSGDPADPPDGPKVDLTKRFYLKAGTDVIASFDTFEEVDGARKDLEERKAHALAEASKVTHMGKLTVADRGMTHETLRQEQEHGGSHSSKHTAVVKNDSDVSVKRDDAVVRSDGGEKP